MTDTCNNLDEPQKGCLSKRSQTQKDCESMFTFCNCIDVVIKSRQKLSVEILIESRAMAACKGSGEMGDGKGSLKRSVKNFLG